jgi:acetyl esterase/lipase
MEKKRSDRSSSDPEAGESNGLGSVEQGGTKKANFWKPVRSYILITLPFVLMALAMLLIGSKWYGWLILIVLYAGIIALRRTEWWKGWRKPVAVLVALVLLCGNVVLTRPDLGVSFMGTLMREGMRFVLKLPPLQGDGLLSLGAQYGSATSNWQPPSGFTSTSYDIGVPVELLVDEKGNHDKLILQLHGGAYVIGLDDMHRDFAVRYSRISGGSSVLSVDYRIAPEHTFPAALEDAIEAWDWLLDQGYRAKDIIVAGDSAGGNLALALVLALRDEGRELPAAIICMSPWADMAAEGQSYSYNHLNDPMFGYKGDPTYEADGTSMTDLYRGDTDPHDPLLSPVYADFTGFPPMLLQVGTYEVLESDSITIYEKARESGVDVTLTRYHGMFHVFQMAGDLLPEGREAWDEVEEFLRLHSQNG